MMYCGKTICYNPISLKLALRGLCESVEKQEIETANLEKRRSLKRKPVLNKGWSSKNEKAKKTLENIPSERWVASTQISKIEGCTRAAMFKRLQALEELGLVERQGTNKYTVWRKK